MIGIDMHVEVEIAVVHDAAVLAEAVVSFELHDNNEVVLHGDARSELLTGCNFVEVDSIVELLTVHH